MLSNTKLLSSPTQSRYGNEVNLYDDLAVIDRVLFDVQKRKSSRSTLASSSVNKENVQQPAIVEDAFKLIETVEHSAPSSITPPRISSPASPPTPQIIKTVVQRQKIPIAIKFQYQQEDEIGDSLHHIISLRKRYYDYQLSHNIQNSGNKQTSAPSSAVVAETYPISQHDDVVISTDGSSSSSSTIDVIDDEQTHQLLEMQNFRRRLMLSTMVVDSTIDDDSDYNSDISIDNMADT